MTVITSATYAARPCGSSLTTTKHICLTLYLPKHTQTALSSFTKACGTSQHSNHVESRPNTTHQQKLLQGAHLKCLRCHHKLYHPQTAPHASCPQLRSKTCNAKRGKRSRRRQQQMWKSKQKPKIISVLMLHPQSTWTLTLIQKPHAVTLHRLKTTQRRQQQLWQSLQTQQHQPDLMTMLILQQRNPWTLTLTRKSQAVTMHRLQSTP